MLYSVFSCFGCAVQLTHLTRVIIRVHILLKLSADDGNTARGWEVGATLFEVARIDKVSSGCLVVSAGCLKEYKTTIRIIYSALLHSHM